MAVWLRAKNPQAGRCRHHAAEQSTVPQVASLIALVVEGGE